MRLRMALRKLQKTVREIKNVYVDGIQAIIEDNKVKKYRVNLKLTFVLED